jgi:hypothetical protein
MADNNPPKTAVNISDVPNTWDSPLLAEQAISCTNKRQSAMKPIHGKADTKQSRWNISIMLGI